jgi:hypothetical protein
MNGSPIRADVGSCGPRQSPRCSSSPRLPTSSTLRTPPRRRGSSMSPTRSRASAGRRPARLHLFPAGRGQGRGRGDAEAHQEARGPAGLYRRLDLHEAERAPPGDRPRRQGRKQYRYHPDFRAVRESTKYEHMLEFAKALPAVRKKIAEHIALPSLPREKVLATVVTPWLFLSSNPANERRVGPVLYCSRHGGEARRSRSGPHRVMVQNRSAR